MTTLTKIHRAEVVGSLLRPPELIVARQAMRTGELPPDEYCAVEDRAVDDALKLQEEIGLDVVTDGEMRRYAFYGHLVEALEGFDKYAGWSITFRDGEGHEASLKRPVVVDKLQWRRQMAVEEFIYLRGRTAKPVKVTLLSAQQASAYYDPDKSKGAYPTRDGYLADLVDFTHRAGRLDPEEVRGLLGPYYARLRSELELFGATVEKFIGDAVVALFGAVEPLLRVLTGRARRGARRAGWASGCISSAASWRRTAAPSRSPTRPAAARASS